MATCAPSAMKSRAIARPMPLLPPVIRAFLPVSFIMPLFCGTGIRYDARHAYGLMTIIDGGCKNNSALSRTFKKKRDSVFLLNVPNKLCRLGGFTLYPGVQLGPKLGHLSLISRVSLL